MESSKITLRPIEGNYYTIEYLDDVSQVQRDAASATPMVVLTKILEKEPHNMAARLELATQLTNMGEVDQACQMRFEGCNMILDILPDDEDIILEWDADTNNQEAIELLYSSGVDHYMHGDYEYAAGLLEMALMLDEEDHFSATVVLGYCYVALQEWELLEETMIDIPTPSLDATLISAWADFEQGKDKNPGKKLQREAPELLAELIEPEHPVDPQFLADIKADRPSKKAQARALYLRTEGLWQTFSGFIEALK